MANFLLNNAFRIVANTLNFLSPSLVADILLHPFDFATVLLQIGYDPEGVKYEGATLVSVIVQYALLTFYIPYLVTSMQGLQFMGMPHPSIFYYVNYIFNKEGFRGCYRGLMPKICERLIMMSVNERVRRRINKDVSNDYQSSSDQDNFLQALINGICSQFFAVLASHPFHVLMVSSFAEFTYNKKSSILELSQSIYSDDGYFGFFTGLTARLMGELLSLIFSITYSTIINKQLRPQQSVEESPAAPSLPKTAEHLVNYVTDISRFTALKSVESEELEDALAGENSEPNALVTQRWFSKFSVAFHNLLRTITQNSSHTSQLRENNNSSRSLPLLEYIPLTSRLFYYIMIRDFLSKKISNPFFLVCHCSIVLDSGWDKFPLITYLVPLVDFVQVHLKPTRKKSKKSFLNYCVISSCLFCKQ